jgi:hypothetical protein
MNAEQKRAFDAWFNAYSTNKNLSHAECAGLLHAFVAGWDMSTHE